MSDPVLDMCALQWLHGKGHWLKIRGKLGRFASCQGSNKVIALFWGYQALSDMAPDMMLLLLGFSLSETSPGKHISYLKSRVFKGDRHSVQKSALTEEYQKAARLHDSKYLCRNGLHESLEPRPLITTKPHTAR